MADDGVEFGEVALAGIGRGGVEQVLEVLVVGFQLCCEVVVVVAVGGEFVGHGVGVGNGAWCDSLKPSWRGTKPSLRMQVMDLLPEV